MAGATDEKSETFKVENLKVFDFVSVCERVTIIVILFFSLLELGFPPEEFDPLLAFCFTIALLTTTTIKLFALMAIFGYESDRTSFMAQPRIKVFFWERISLLLTISCQYYRYESYQYCIYESYLFIVLCGSILTVPYVINLKTIENKKNNRQERESKENKEKLDSHEIKESKEDREKLDCGVDDESKTIRDDDQEQNNPLLWQGEELKKLKSVCFNLEEEKKSLMLKLDIANETMEYYQGIIDDFTEQSLMWYEEKKVLSQKLEAASFPPTSSNYFACASQNHQKPNLEEIYRNGEAYDFYSYNYNRHNLFNEIQQLSMKVEGTRNEIQQLSMEVEGTRREAEFHRVCRDDNDEICRKLKIELKELSAKHVAERLSAERYLKFSKELEEKNRRLEEEKNDLSAKLNTSKTLCEVYCSLLRDGFTHDNALINLHT